MSVMAKKKPVKATSSPFQIRLHPKLREQLERLANRNASEVTEEIRTAIRKHLKEEGFWPPEPDAHS